MTIQSKIVTQTSVFLTIDGQTYNFTTDSHKYFDRIREALKAGDDDEVERLVDSGLALKKDFGSEHLTIDNGILAWKGRELDNVLSNRVISLRDEGFDITYMVKFIENLMENPSFRAVEQLYRFLEATGISITDDGHFLAYKMVSQDYTSLHDGKTLNRVGDEPSMPRNEVEEDPNKTCSKGLHFCSQSYLNFYTQGPRVMLVKVNPRDVVSIPTDYNNSKGRACRYKIIGELDQKKVDRFASKNEDRHTFNKSVVQEDDLFDHTVTTQTNDGNRYKEKYGLRVLEDGKPRDNDLVTRKWIVTNHMFGQTAYLSVNEKIKNGEFRVKHNRKGHMIEV